MVGRSPESTLIPHPDSGIPLVTAQQIREAEGGTIHSGKNNGSYRWVDMDVWAKNMFANLYTNDERGLREIRQDIQTLLDKRDIRLTGVCELIQRFHDDKRGLRRHVDTLLGNFD